MKHPRRTREREITHNQKSSAGTASLKRRDPPCSSFRRIRSSNKELASFRTPLMHPGELSAFIQYVHTGENPLFYADDPAGTVSCRGEWKLLLFSIKSRWLRHRRTKLKCMCKLARLIWRGVAWHANSTHVNSIGRFWICLLRATPSFGISTQCQKWQTERELNLQC